MAEKKNWIIEYEDWTNYEAETEEEAIEKFKDQYGNAQINKVMLDG